MFTTPATTLVCVDEMIDGDFYGTIWNPLYPDGQKFYGVLQMTTLMEAVFDRLSFPLQFQALRSFRPQGAENEQKSEQKKDEEAQLYMDNLVFETKRGERATFVIQVQFRQNASWQGTITWSEKKKSQRFRSTLELIKLIDSAIEMAGPQDAPAWD